MSESGEVLSRLCCILVGLYFLFQGASFWGYNYDKPYMSKLRKVVLVIGAFGIGGVFLFFAAKI